MPGSVPIMAVQKKQSAIPPSLGLFSTRTTESHWKGNGSEKLRENCTYMKANSQAKKMASSLNKSAQLCNTESPRAAPGSNVDERLKLARDRREEHQRLLASRELSRLEREQRARRYYEKQLQERKKKLLEQRLKEQRRRAAVEEKRKQRQQEEKERYESAVRKTMEKSQKAQQNLSQNSRGRKISQSSVPRRLPLTPWEKKLVSRLLTPTCSFLARSKSAGCQSGAEVSFHSMNTTTPPKPQHQSVSAQHWTSGAVGNRSKHHRGVNLVQVKPSRLKDADKSSNIGSPAVKPTVKPAAVVQNKTAACSPDRTPRKSVKKPPAPLQLELPSVPEEDFAVCGYALYPGNSRPVRTSAAGQPERMRDENRPETPCSSLSHTETHASVVTEDESTSHPPPQPPGIMSRSSNGTTDPEEAWRLLAEKKREARVQREREEQERLQRAEAERRSREELEQRRAQERARQQAEAQRLIQEKRRREEEEQRRAEEERAQAMREAALLQKQREEEQAKERAKAEQMRQEREMLMQKEEAERQARKKRLEEIMRRTRRTESPDTNSVPVRILPKEDTELVQNVKVPVGSKTSQLGLNVDEDMVPVVAFKERRSVRTLAGLEKIQTHQRAEVI